MDKSQIELIVKIVISELEKAGHRVVDKSVKSNLPKCFVFGWASDTLYERYRGKLDFECTISECEFALTSGISPFAVNNAAVGISSTIVEHEITNCFLNNKPLYILDYTLEKSRCNPSYLALCVQNQSRLKSFGVKFFTSKQFAEMLSSKRNITATSKKLYTQKEIAQLEAGSIINIKNAILTPLAKDIAREKGINIVLD